VDNFWLVTQEFDEMTGDTRFYGPEYQLLGPTGLFGKTKIPSATPKPVWSADLLVIQPAAIIEETGAISYWWAFKASTTEGRLFDNVSTILTLVDGKRDQWESLETISELRDDGQFIEVVMVQLDAQMFRDGQSCTELKIRVTGQDFELVSDFKAAMGQLMGAVGGDKNQGFVETLKDTQSSTDDSHPSAGSNSSSDIRADESERGPRRLDL